MMTNALRKTPICHHDNPLSLSPPPPLKSALKKYEEQLNFLDWSFFISEIFKSETGGSTKIVLQVLCIFALYRT